MTTQAVTGTPAAKVPDPIILYNPSDPVGMKVASIVSAVEKKRSDVVSALPRGIEFDFWLRSVQTAFIESPDLLACSGPSLMKAVMNSAYVGLAPNKQLGLAAFVKFGGDCVYMPMIQGLVKLALLHPAIKDVQTSVVYEGDEFHYQRGTSPSIHHVPSRRAKGGDAAIVAAYSIAWMANGAMSFEVLEADDIAKIRNVAKTDNVWRTWEGEMARKSAFRRHRKWLPTSAELLRAIEVESEIIEATATVKAVPGQSRTAQLEAQIADKLPDVKDEMRADDYDAAQIDGDPDRDRYDD